MQRSGGEIHGRRDSKFPLVTGAISSTDNADMELLQLNAEVGKGIGPGLVSSRFVSYTKTTRIFYLYIYISRSGTLKSLYSYLQLSEGRDERRHLDLKSIIHAHKSFVSTPSNHLLSFPFYKLWRACID